MKSIFIICVLVFYPLALLAEDVFITDQLKAGLHEDKSLDSPIVKIVATGTRLEIVKREDRLTYVRDASGTSGWINNEYLMARAPDNAALVKLRSRTDDLEKRLSEFREKNITLETRLKRQGKVLPADVLALKELKAEHTKLKQDFNTQKLKSGQLQIELTELRKRVGQDNDTETLYQQIKSLEEDKKTLEIQFAITLDSYEAEGAEGFNVRNSGIAGGFSPGLRNMIIYLAITLVLGLFGGAYLLDFVNRRRHGGFRI